VTAGREIIGNLVGDRRARIDGIRLLNRRSFRLGFCRGIGRTNILTSTRSLGRGKDSHLCTTLIANLMLSLLLITEELHWALMVTAGTIFHLIDPRDGIPTIDAIVNG
jgi:hypothetical protein